MRGEGRYLIRIIDTRPENTVGEEIETFAYLCDKNVNAEAGKIEITN